MSTDQWISVLQPLLPTFLLVFGGHWILGRYELRKKTREEEIALVRTVREQQYGAVSSLYERFGELMELYRRVNNSPSYPKDEDEWKSLLRRSEAIEAGVDALILRIACEFNSAPDSDLEQNLGHMRQSVQLWRETIRDKKRLPFGDSHQVDYAKFKETFAGVATFMIHHVHHGLTPPKTRTEEAKDLFVGVFSNKYEKLEYRPVQGRERWVKDVKKTDRSEDDA